jgi:hypothetical protein
VARMSGASVATRLTVLKPKGSFGRSPLQAQGAWVSAAAGAYAGNNTSTASMLMGQGGIAGAESQIPVDNPTNSWK